MPYHCLSLSLGHARMIGFIQAQHSIRRMNRGFGFISFVSAFRVRDPEFGVSGRHIRSRSNTSSQLQLQQRKLVGNSALRPNAKLGPTTGPLSTVVAVSAAPVSADNRTQTARQIQEKRKSVHVRTKCAESAVCQSARVRRWPNNELSGRRWASSS